MKIRKKRKRIEKNKRKGIMQRGYKFSPALQKPINPFLHPDPFNPSKTPESSRITTFDDIFGDLPEFDQEEIEEEKKNSKN